MTHSKLPWRIREHPRDPDRFHIEAERNDPLHPYDIEVMGDDTGLLYPVEQRRSDAELIVRATMAYEAIQRIMTGCSRRDIAELEQIRQAMNLPLPKRS